MKSRAGGHHWSPNGIWCGWKSASTNYFYVCHNQNGYCDQSNAYRTE